MSFSIFPNEQLSGRPVSTGQAFTSYDVDFTVKVEATGLKADTQYWYVFKDCTNGESTSPVGRTRTLSSPNSTFYLSIIVPTSSLTSWKHLQTRLMVVNHSLSQFSPVPATKTVDMLHSFGVLRTYIIILLSGYFNAYGVAAQNTSADVFVHLGDYVGAYEQCSFNYSIMVALDI